MSLIAIEEMSIEEIVSLLELGERFLSETGKVVTPVEYGERLSSKAIALLFFEPSTRTRVSFELAAKRLAATTVLLDASGSSVKKGETILDTARNLEAMGMDAIVLRASDRDAPYILREELGVPVINAGNGAGEHPSQGLLDALCVVRALGDERGLLTGRTITIVGDVVRSRVARSGVHVFEKLGANVILAGPVGMVPGDGLAGWGSARTVHDRDEAISVADAVIVLRIQRERMQAQVIDLDDYIDVWRIDQEVVEAIMKPGALLMHPGPVNRGVELTSEVADSSRSKILEQVRCGVAMRQAILLKTFGRDA